MGGNSEPSVSGRKARVLNGGQAYKVYEWAKQHQDKLRTECPSLEDLSERVLRDLEIDAGGRSLLRKCREAGVTWKPSRSPPVVRQPPAVVVDGTQERLAAVEGQLRSLTAAIGDLQFRLEVVLGLEAGKGDDSSVAAAAAAEVAGRGVHR